jgi:hypothetical protein
MPPPPLAWFPPPPLRVGEVISRLGEQLEEAGMQEVFAIPRARMPVVKFVHPDTGWWLGLGGHGTRLEGGWP